MGCTPTATLAILLLLATRMHEFILLMDPWRKGIANGKIVRNTRLVTSEVLQHLQPWEGGKACFCSCVAFVLLPFVME